MLRYMFAVLSSRTKAHSAETLLSITISLPFEKEQKTLLIYFKSDSFFGYPLFKIPKTIRNH